MSIVPEVGTVLGDFTATLDRDRVWRTDWAVGLDRPEYQDPEVARAVGHRDIPVPPGALVFFSFLDDDSWLKTAGIRFDRSLAVRRTIRNHCHLYVGDVVCGRSLIDGVEIEETERSMIIATTIGTRYEVNGRLAVEEGVTYSTRLPREER